MEYSHSNSELTLSGEDFSSLMQSVLKNKADFRFKAKGNSMSPFIRHLDIVTISPLFDKTPQTGDIVAASIAQRKSIMVHRVIAQEKGKFILKGDNNQSRDGVVDAVQIYGGVIHVERKGSPVWFGKGIWGKAIAVLSKTGSLNRIILPGLRFVRRAFPF